MRANYAAAFIAFLSGAVFSFNLLGQATAREDRFEVISIRPFTPDGSGMRGGPLARKGGPGTSDPERISWTGVSQETILEIGYGVSRFQISGPDWLRDQARYNVVATVPPGTTKEQFHVMLQNLLKDRFHMSLHHALKEMPAYDLVVAVNGPKLKESEQVGGQPVVGALSRDDNGRFVLPVGSHGMAGKMENGVLLASIRTSSMLDFADDLSQLMQVPVFDTTGLTGIYDFTLDFSMDDLPRVYPNRGSSDPSGGPSLFTALQNQLGLKLVSKKEPIDVLVIDSTDRAPTEN
jgi:uncharacterized protein (TIGR03435 family)